jgi:TrmH family RNA methyltransferase
MITSLHSSHVEKVKALLGPRGSKAREEKKMYVVEGPSNVASLIRSKPDLIESIYLTSGGREKLQESWTGEIIEVSDQVMKAMTDTVTPQGVLALVNLEAHGLDAFKGIPNPKLAYFWQIQDPGNAGTVIRTADAFGFDGVIFSDNSVDVYSPKVIRSTAGSLWQIQIATEITLAAIAEFAKLNQIEIFTTSANGSVALADISKRVRDQGSIWIFGNEARGLNDEAFRSISATSVSIPMSGSAESLNLATAASVVMYAVANA